MHRILELGAGNAATVAILAVAVYTFSRFYWRPAVVHTLWVLLFVKLLTPPLAEVPIPTQRISAAWQALIQTAEHPYEAARAGSQRDESLVGLGQENGESDAPRQAAHRPEQHAGSTAIAVDAEPFSGPTLPVAAADRQADFAGFSGRIPLVAILTWIWLAGICLISASVAVRIIRFRRLLRQARPAPVELVRQVERLAAELGMRQAPRLLLSDVPSPMLWGLPPATILFPPDLLDVLDRRAQQTLLLHELAHYRRRDHWIRLLEILATVLYWWHPCVWWGRRELRAAEEECCDAWVILQKPENRSVYARALMSVIDRLGGTQVRIPPAASGIGDFQAAAKRLHTIMLGSPQREMTRWGRATMTCVALPLLLLAPTFAQTDEPATADPTPELPLPRTVEPGEFERLPIVLNLQREGIRELGFSADGTRMVAAYGERWTSGCLRVWDIAQNREVASFPEPRGIYSAHISADGRRVASCSFSDRLIRVRDVESGRLVGEIRPGDQLARVRFSPDGKRLATASTDGKLLVWDVEAVLVGDGPACEPAQELAALEFNLQCVAFSRDGQQIAAGGGPMGDESFGWAGLWELATGVQIATMAGMPESALGISISTDGSELATAGGDGLARIWNAETGDLVKVFGRTDAPLEWVEFSPDGALLATASYDDTAVIWNAETGGEVALLDGHLGNVMSVRFSPDGRTVATGGEDQVIRLWNVATQQRIGEIRPASNDQDAPSAVLALASSPDGQFVATAHGDRKVRLRDIAERTVVRQFGGHDDVVTSLAFSPDGDTLATASYDGTVRLADVQSGAEIRTLVGHTGWVTSVAFSPDGATLASSGDDATVRLWDASTGEQLRRLAGHAAAVRSVAFSPDGNWLATGSSDRTVRIWDVASGKHRRTFSGHAGAVRTVAFHPAGTIVATASEDSSVRLWDLATGKEIWDRRAHPQMVWSLAFSPSGRTLVSGGMGGVMCVWDTKTGTCRQMLRDHRDIVSSLAFVPNGGSLISGGYDMAVKQWIPAPAPLEEIAHRSAGRGLAASFVAFSIDGRRLLALDKQSGTCRTWDSESGRLVREFQPHGGNVPAAALSPDGRLLAAAQLNRSIRLWDIETAVMRMELPARFEVRALSFSPDGRQLASAGGDVARIWDLETEKLLAKTPSQDEELQGIAFSPDGAHFVTCSGNWVRPRQGQVKLWDVATGEEIALLGAHNGRINAVQFSPDGRQLIAATNQGGVLLIFDMERREKIAELRLGSADAVISFSQTRDGRRVAVGQANGRVSLWDLRSRRRLLDYVGHTPSGTNNTALVWSLAFSPDQRMLASAGYDDQGRTVRLWPTSLTEPVPVQWTNSVSGN